MKFILTYIVVIFCTLSMSSAFARPSKEEAKQVREKHKEASSLFIAGENEASLALIEEGLNIVEDDKNLLLLRGHVLLKKRDFLAASEAYQVYIDAGARGGNRREVLKILKELKEVAKTILIVNVSNGPAEIYLDSRSEGVFCKAEPICEKNIIPGRRKLIIQKEGYERWSQTINIKAGSTLEITQLLVEKPSELILENAPENASIFIDDVPFDPKQKISPGEHTIRAELEGYGPREETILAQKGEAISLSLALSPLVLLKLSPPSAEVYFEENLLPIEEGKIALPLFENSGPKSLIAKAEGYHDTKIFIPENLDKDDTLSIELNPVGSFLSIKNAPKGATLSVDGENTKTLPLDAPIELSPGEHKIEILAEGFLPFKTEASFSMNTPTELKLSMKKTKKSKTWYAYGAAGGTAVLGSVFGLLAIDQRKSFETRSQLPNVVTESDSDGKPVDRELRRLQSRGEGFSLLSDISFAATIAAAGVGTYFFLKEGRGLSEGKITVRAGIGAGGVAISGSF